MGQERTQQGDASRVQQTRQVLFHIDGEDLFDKEALYRRIGTTDGQMRVIVDLAGDGDRYCPVAMARWMRGGRGACGLEFRFDNPFEEGDYWFHLSWGAWRAPSSLVISCNGEQVAQTEVGQSGRIRHDRFRMRIPKGPNVIFMKLADSRQSVNLRDIALSTHESLDSLPLPVCATARVTTLSEYARAIGVRGVRLDNMRVRLFAPAERQREAEVLFGFLVRGQEALRKDAGGDLPFKAVVQLYPKHNPWMLREAFSETCVLPHGIDLLRPSTDDEGAAARGALLEGLRELYAAHVREDVKAPDLVNLLEKSDSLAGTPPFVVRTGPAPAGVPADMNDGKRRTNTAEVLFHVGGDTLFDRDNLFRFDERPDDSRRVTVDLDARMVRCPFEMGERIRGLGRERINGVRGPHELALVFDNRFAAGTYRFHVLWRAAKDEGEGFEVICNGTHAGESGGPTPEPDSWTRSQFRLPVREGRNQVIIRSRSPEVLIVFFDLALTTFEDMDALPRPVYPAARVTSVQDFEKVAREPGLILDSKYVRLVTGRSMEILAREFFPYLVKTYDAFYGITGVHTRYKLVLFATPHGCTYSTGGTFPRVSIIPYGYDTIDPNARQQEMWREHGVPRIRGIAEEMGHCFTMGGPGVGFGGEALGVFVCYRVIRIAAPYPGIEDPYAEGGGNRQTVADYIANGYRLPDKPNYPPVTSYRIYQVLLDDCEKAYGPDLLKDFFTEVRKTRTPIKPDSPTDYSKRLQLTVECFDRLPGLNFRERMRKLRLSQRTTWYSLYGKTREWGGKLLPPDERQPGDYADE